MYVKIGEKSDMMFFLLIFEYQYNMQKGIDDDNVSVSSSLSADEPITPKHISEVTFTSWADQYSKCEKMSFEEKGEKESRLFWLKTTRDFTKLSEMQRYYQFLRYAQLRPKLHHLIRAHYFEIWRKGVYSSRWRRLSRLILMKKYLDDIGESGERVKYVRSKISGKMYKEIVNDEKSKQSLDVIASDMLNTVNPLSILMPKPEVPVRENTALDSPFSSSMVNSPKSPNSPRSTRSPKSPRSSKSPKSPKSPKKSPTKSREVDLMTNEDVEVQAQVTKCESEVQTLPLQKKNNIPLLILIFLIALIAGMIAFFFISPAGVFRSSFDDE